MPRTVPSQIVALVDQGFPDLRLPISSVDHSSAAKLTAIARLIDEIPSELLAISGQDYTDLVCGHTRGLEHTIGPGLPSEPAHEPAARG
jgi:hypothetical protein